MYFLIRLIDLACSIYILMIIVRALVSWINPNARHPVLEFITAATEPVLAPVRRVLPPISGIDFSPLVVIILIGIIERIIIRFLAPVPVFPVY